MKRAMIFLLTMVLAGSAIAAPQGAGIVVKAAWVRWLPANLPAGGYLTLINEGAEAVSLVGAACPDYGSVSLHHSQQHGGVSEMTPVAAIRIPAHTTLDFAAEGYHLMLLQPKRPLKPGDRVSITLTFSTGDPVVAQFELRPANAGAD